MLARFSTFIIVPMALVNLVFLLSCHQQSNFASGEVATAISGFIAKNCAPQDICQFQLKDVTNFSWDRFFVFDLTVDNDVISKQIGSEFSSSIEYYSNKWFYLKDGELIHFEQRAIPEIDEYMKPGDIDFDISSSKDRYAVFDTKSVFEVNRIKVNGGEAFLLKCVNCQ